MRKIIAFLLVLSLLIGQSVLAAEGFEDVSLEPENELCCGEKSLIEELHESLIQKRLLETQQQLYTDLVQPANIMPYLKGAELMPSTGNVKMLVLPISYLDSRQYEENFDMEEWEARFFAPYDPELKLWEQSVRGFYYAASYGQLDIAGTVLPVYRAPLTGKKYDDDPDLAEKLYTEALTYYCEQGLDISQFDNDGDGSLDALVIHQLRKGSTEHSYSGVARGVNGTIDGYDINTAAIIFHQELYDLGSRVYEHEIGHLLGLLDNYNASAGNSVIGAKAYELMSSSGTYINVYYKYLLGWIEPIILTEEDSVQTLELSAVELQPNGVDTPPKAIILIPNAVALPFTEYYIMEYRAGGVKEQRVDREDLIYDLNPGIVIWHCNTRLNEHLQYKYDTNYLKPVPRSENTTYSEKDIYTTGDIFSSNSIPSTNSDFYDGTYTGIYMKVGEITPEKAIVQAGFRFPKLAPAPIIEVSLPSKTVIRKGEKSTVVITTKLGDELLSPDLIDYRNIYKFSTSGTVSIVGTIGSALVNPFTVTIPGYTNTGLEADGTIWADIPAGAVRYNGKDSAAVTSEKIYVDNTPPEITLQGANPQRIQQGTAYTELGAIALDNLDPDIEGKLEIDTSQVNTNVLGSYTVTYSVTDHAGHSATEERTIIVEEGPPPHTHDYATAWSSNETGHWHACGGCEEKGGFAAHAPVTDPAVEATCTTPGKTQGSHCSVCGYVITAQTETPLKAHSYSEIWSNDNSNHWHECTICKEKTDQAAHTWDGGQVTTVPTSSKTGVRTYTCTVCSRTRTETIPATGGGSSSGGGGSSGGSSSSRPAIKKPEQSTPEPPAEVTPEPVKLPFTDVPEKAWYYEAVQAVYGQGIMTGMKETLFEPELPTSRGMVVTMLYRMEGEPAAKAEETFTDVPGGKYYADAVAWCVENGIVTGYGDGTFRPDRQITREQLVTILYRYSVKKGCDVTERADLSGFFDEGQITGYAREAMEWANATGLLGGADWGGIDPGGAATRAQVAAVLERLLEKWE